MDDRAHPELVAARRELDVALLALCAVTDAELPSRALEEQLAQALEHVYVGLSATSDAQRFAQAVEHARTCAERAAELGRTSASAARDDAFAASTAALARAQRRLAATRYKPGCEPLSLPREHAADETHASVGVPRLLDPPRPVLRPSVPLAALPPPAPALPSVPSTLPAAPPTSSAALDALMAKAVAAARDADAPPEPAATSQPAPVVAPPAAELVAALRFGELAREADVRAERASLLLDELGMLAAMRRPDDEDPWTSNRECERRMLCRIDALLAQGTELWPRLIKRLEDRPVPDPELWLALLLLQGCLRGDDARDQLARLLWVAPLAEDDVLVAAIDGLSLSPHPALRSLLAPWLSDSLPQRRALACGVLGRKRMLDAEQLTAACQDDDVRVLRAVALALRKYDGPVPSALPRALATHDDHEVAKHALYAAAMRDDAFALEHARALCQDKRPAHADAAHVCALAGGRDELRGLQASAGPELLSALGFYGDVDAVPLLLSALDAGDDADKAAAAPALHRLLGVALDGDASPEAVLEDAAGAPFLPGYREPVAPVQLTLDAGLWRALWERHERTADRAQRYRYGRAFCAAHDLWELSHPAAVRRDRERAHLELCVRFGVRAALDTETFVLAQRPQVSALAALLGDPRAIPLPFHSRLAR